MNIKDIEAKARELRQLQVLIEEAQEEAEALRDAIKAAMGDSETVQAGEYKKITWKPVTSIRIDTRALKEALPDVAERFKKETTVRRFTVA
nr:MAG TPA: Exonuclease [Caudoviricetes sp.]